MAERSPEEAHSPEPRPAPDPPRLPPGPTLADLPLSDLVNRTLRRTESLVRKEVELARADAEADLRRELRAGAGLGASGVSALLTVALLLVAAVFGLVEAGLAGWLASLIVAAAVLAVGTVAGLVGWRRRVREPMAATRRSVQEGVTWAKDLR